jgi:hypothetical protein
LKLILNFILKILKTIYFIFIGLIIGLQAYSQTAKVKGVILDDLKNPIVGVNVSFDKKGTTTDNDGFYTLNVPANQNLTIIYTHVSFKKATLKVNLANNEELIHNFIMDMANEIEGIVVYAGRSKRVEGVTAVDIQDIRRIPGGNAGVENIIKTLGGASSNNELSTQYSVRGGNYDENLVYVNEIEVYRPFLIRSGQQEGLSFVNTDLVSNVDFSAGGFQAKYGDKLSSVLDITYKRPTEKQVSLEASFLGGSLAYDWLSKNRKWSSVTGVRYRDNSLLVNSQETETNFRPRFADVQSFWTFNPNDKWQFNFLGNLSQNRYDFQPLFRQTNFGSIDAPKAIQIRYQGQEQARYTTMFGAFKANYFLNNNTTIKSITSVYHTAEQEYFDIYARYSLGEVDTNLGSETFGDIQFARGIGSQLLHGRNDLDALIINQEIKANHKIKHHQIDWAVKYTREDFRDRLVEWEVIDSAGFNINPPNFQVPNQQPYVPYVGPLVPFQNVRATNFATVDRFSGYVQWSSKTITEKAEYYYNAGVRANQWTVSGRGINPVSQIVFSPRAQIAVKPNWKRDMLFRLSGGLYHQPPMYREFRDFDGVLRPETKAQQAVHIIGSHDYSFKWQKRPFKMVTEVYYKSLTNVNTYTLENVRIRYRADNLATAYTYGADLRINGEFVPGTESWITLGYMKTEENYNNRGFIARPTDQRFRVALLFQDYMPVIKNFKVYLNLVYNTGLPGGSPSYADPYLFQDRLRDYKRADIGMFYVFTENNAKRRDGHWLKRFKELSLGAEIFNAFNVQNAISNTWVRDVEEKAMIPVPNFMTTRVFNVKLNARF